MKLFLDYDMPFGRNADSWQTTIALWAKTPARFVADENETFDELLPKIEEWVHAAALAHGYAASEVEADGFTDEHRWFIRRANGRRQIILNVQAG